MHVVRSVVERCNDVIALYGRETFFIYELRAKCFPIIPSPSC